ncbi:hypothetical protein AAG906_014329 [Vitis piasezkii]
MTRTGGTLNATAATPAASVQPHSPWHSPVPYLFGGLAAMLGLIAFALLILACSYWKLSGYLEGDDDSAARDAEAGDGAGGDAVKPPMAFEEKILVIMAGDVKPTYLATPMSSRASSFGERSSNNSEMTEKSEAVAESPKQGSENQVQTGNREARET